MAPHAILLGNMTILEAILLGAVQGFTEFLPISSSGHLVLAREIFSIAALDVLAFDAILHLATTLAVIVYFWRDIMVLVHTLLRMLSRLPVETKNVVLLKALALGTLPAVVIGFFLESFVSEVMQTAFVVATVLFAGGLFFIYAEWRYFKEPREQQLSVRSGLLIGFFQAAALLPGLSRSGATIAGGMLLGLTRHEAARFSFLLAIPITLGLGAKKLLDMVGSEETVEWMAVFIGAITAFIVAIIVIHYFLQFIRKHTLWPFIWYSLILSLFVGYWLFVI